MQNNTILIVDDDPEILAFHRKIFSPSQDAEFDILGSHQPTDEADLNCLTFADPRELIEAYGKMVKAGERVPLCIIDMRMPSMNGLTAALQIREIDPDIGIVICTAFSDISPEQIRLKLQRGCFFVHKPFVVEEFLLLIRSLVGNWNAQRELKQVKGELATQCDRFARVLEATHTGTWDWDISTGRVEYNERWAEIIGYKLSELAPTIETWMKACHPEDLGKSNTLIQQVFSKEIVYYDCKCRMLHKNGQWVWVWDRGKVIEWSPEGKPLRMAGTHADVTEEETAKIALIETQGHIELFFEIALDLLCITDLQGRFVRVSRAWEELLGHSRKNLKGKLFMDCVHPEDIAATEAALAGLNQGKPVIGFVNRYRAGSGDWRYIEWRARPVNGYVFAVARDVTEAKAMQAALEHALERERQTTELKSRLVSMASHEFRTPLATIRLSADILSSFHDKLDSVALQEHLKTIIETSDYMVGIVSDVLDFNSVGHMFDKGSLIEMNLKDFLAQMAREFNPEARKGRDVPFEWDEKPVCVRVIPALLKRAVHNLLDNAFKYSPPTSPVVLRLKTDADIASISVEDSGIGIPAADAASLLDPFFRASNTVGIPGTGLGLAIVAEAIERMSGKIEHADRPEGGTIFTIHLPCTEKAACGDKAKELP